MEKLGVILTEHTAGSGFAAIASLQIIALIKLSTVCSCGHIPTRMPKGTIIAVEFSVSYKIYCPDIPLCRSQWPSGLRRGSAAGRR